MGANVWGQILDEQGKTLVGEKQSRQGGGRLFDDQRHCGRTEELLVWMQAELIDKYTQIYPLCERDNFFVGRESHNFLY